MCLGDYEDMVLSPAPPGLPEDEQHDEKSAAVAVAGTGPTPAAAASGRGVGGGGGGGGGLDAAALPFWSPEQLCGAVGKPSDGGWR